MFHLLLFFWFHSSLQTGPQATPAETDSYTVYIFLSEDCPICRYYVHEINRLHEKYQSDKLEFVGVFPNFSSKQEKINTFVSDYHLKIPTQTDYFKSLAKKLDAELTPEVFVVNQQEEIVYRGRIDNSYASIGKRRRVVTERDLDTYLSELTSGTVSISHTEAIGCYIHYSDFN